MKKISWLLMAAALFVLASCGSDVVENTQDEQAVVVEEAAEEPVEEAASEAREPEEERPDAVDFTLTSSTGESISLSDYEGKIVFVNFFTTWCTYCDLEMPDFQAAYEAHGGDVVFLLVDVYQSERISTDEVVQWYEERGYTMPMVIDEEGIATVSYPVRAFPTTFVVDREGKVMGYLEGAMEADMIESIILQADM